MDLKKIENFIRESKVNLSRQSKNKEKFITQLLDIICEKTKNNKSDDILCLKPNKQNDKLDSIRKSGVSIYTQKDSQQADKDLKNIRKRHKHGG